MNRSGRLSVSVTKMDTDTAPAAGTPLQFRVLGPLEVRDGDHPIRIPPGRVSALLATLLLRHNQVVPVHELIERIWDHKPPVQPLSALQVYVARLRRALGRAGMQVVRTDSAGYAARIDSTSLDLLRFKQLLDRAAAAQARSDVMRQSELLADALALWQRPILSNVRSDSLLRDDIDRLDEQWAYAVEQRIDADLTLGRHRKLVEELYDLVGRFPTREPFWAQLMTALYRSGRQADALDAYRLVHDVLATEIGISPGPQLQQLHRQILTADPDLGSSTPATVALPRPAQLPSDTAAFTGRSAELAQLLSVAAPGEPGRSAPAIAAVVGMPGVGKTALTVHAAHRLASRFPDGQLFLDLHGFSPDGSPVDPADALDRMLRSLGVAGGYVPDGLDDRAALYRSKLADLRILIVLDNAASEAQVAPLLPAAPGCAVLLTSRRTLTGLDDVRRIDLDVMAGSDAITLFRRCVGPGGSGDGAAGGDGAEGEGDDAADLVELCGRLPLAIRIAAARLAAHPSWTARDLAARLRDRQRALIELNAGSRRVTAALDLSYQGLLDEQQRAYRLFGVCPGSDIDVAAASALFDSTAVDAATRLDALLDVHLIGEPTAGRYRFHDLVRAHARNLAEPDEAATALSRLLGHYAAASTAAVARFYPDEHLGPPGIESAATFDTREDAAAWLDGELGNIVAATGAASTEVQLASVVSLFANLRRYVRARGFLASGHGLAACALAASRGGGDAVGEVRALTELGEIHRVRGRYDDAERTLDQALTIARGSRDQPGEVGALIALAHLHVYRGRHALVVERLPQALDLARELGDRRSEQAALSILGDTLRLTGRFDLATEHLERALELARHFDDRDREAESLLKLGFLHRDLGRAQTAVAYFEQALAGARVLGLSSTEFGALRMLAHISTERGCLERAGGQLADALLIARQIGHRMGEVAALTGTARVHRLRGRPDAALEHYQRALVTAREITDRNGEFEALLGLGHTHRPVGRAIDALEQFRAALDLARQLGQPTDEARARHGLALAHHDLETFDAACGEWRQALAILDRLGLERADDVDATEIRDRLRCLGQLTS